MLTHKLHNELAAIAEMLAMLYSSFTLAKVKKEFGLTTIEAGRFLPPIDPIAPSSRLQAMLEDLPWAIAVGSEKAKSEGIIYPVLQEVRRILQMMGFNSFENCYSEALLLTADRIFQETISNQKKGVGVARRRHRCWMNDGVSVRKAWLQAYRWSISPSQGLSRISC